MEIGKGSFGKVVRPGFACQGRAGHGYVSKIFASEQHGKQQRQNYQALNLAEIDPRMNYFITTADYCPVEGLPYVLNYVDGGDAISKLTDCRMILRGLENIFQGVALLHAHGIYHLDIKEDNIVSSDRFRLIDFGLSRTGTHPPEGLIGSPLYIPPEMYFIGSRVPSASIYDIFVRYTYLPIIRTIGLNVAPENFPPLSAYAGLTDKEYYSKVDIWALGIILHRLLRSFRIKGLRSVVRKLLKLNVRERPDADGALRIYQKFLIEHLGRTPMVLRPNSIRVPAKISGPAR